MKNFYDKATKTFTLQGPMSIPVKWSPNPAFPGILNYGVPMFVMNVAKVSDNNVEVVGNTPPHENLSTLTPYTLRVTVRNGTGSIITSYNGAFQTTVRFGALGTIYVNATDANYTMDAKGSITVIAITLIPEFPTLLLPVLGSAALLVMMKAKRKRS